MRHYINTYINNVEALLGAEGTDLERLREEQLRQIAFICHERIVHLHVTVMCCLILFMGLIIYFMTGIDAVALLDAIMLVLSLAYLLYYFFIENSTQALYCQYNRICLKLGKDDPTIQRLYDDLSFKPARSKKPNIKIN
ncbi:MAG: hypothetical protein J6N70_17795 [Oribacterium sp.]|nr:hypothetical protein [Oribacterium sp.]MBQ5331574.1 hypothetical protein [Oscillospiraceae bacterium]